MNAPRTEAGRRLLRMFETTEGPRHLRWPRAFDARLAERIVEELVPTIEEEVLASRSDEMGYVSLWNDVRPIVEEARKLLAWQKVYSVDPPSSWQNLKVAIERYEGLYPEHLAALPSPADETGGAA